MNSNTVWSGLFDWGDFDAALADLKSQTA